MIDSHLNCKAQILFVSNKIKRNIGMISKIRHFVDISICINLYYALIYPFLIYGLIVWGNTYPLTIKPLFLLQKKVIRLMTFSSYYDHTNPLFIQLKIIKFNNLVYNFYSGKLPQTFDEYFILVNQRHNYNTRHASRSSYLLPKIRTNYGKFNIRFVGAKVWNLIDEDIKNFSLSKFKDHFKN